MGWSGVRSEDIKLTLRQATRSAIPAAGAVHSFPSASWGDECAPANSHAPPKRIVTSKTGAQRRAGLPVFKQSYES